MLLSQRRRRASLGAWRQLSARRLALSVVTLASAVVAGTVPSGSSPAANPAVAPLASAFSTTQSSWAIVAMGQLNQPNDTFWQLFRRSSASAAWTLVTPPAVADNGGLAAAFSSTSTAIVGFEPSQLLTFSPLARSTDGGQTWSPSVLPSGLLGVPDAVAAEPGGSRFALVRTAGGTVLGASDSRSAWRAVVGMPKLAASPAGRACGLTRLSAVADHSGEPVVGGSCAAGGQVGVLTRGDGGWRLSRPRLPGAAGARPTTVLRLESGADGTAGLVEAGGPSPVLFAMWRPALTAPWSYSAGLRLSGRIIATGFGSGGSEVVVSSVPGGGGQAETVTGPKATWSALPPLPRRTAVVNLDPGGGASALAVAGKVLTTFTLDPAGGHWLRQGTVSVPLQYGSST